MILFEKKISRINYKRSVNMDAGQNKYSFSN